MNHEYEEEEGYGSFSVVTTSLPKVISTSSLPRVLSTSSLPKVIATKKPMDDTSGSGSATPAPAGSAVASTINSSSTTPEKASVSGIVTAAKPKSTDETFEAFLGLLSGEIKQEYSVDEDTTYTEDLSTVKEEKEEDIMDSKKVIKIDDSEQEDKNSVIKIDEDEDKSNIRFQDEITWNRNDEEDDAIDEFLKNRIIDSFKNNILKPREHQWKTIQSVLKDLIKPKHNSSFKSDKRYHYLIQHAAGSGKSLTIAMLVYFLYKIEVNNKLKFDTIVIMNDRTQLDAQLGDIIIRFLQSNGIVNFCRPKTSKQLQKEINAGKNRIIITTMQKFAQLLPSQTRASTASMSDEFAFKFNNVAIISDEAHRSHGKSTTEKLHSFLNGNTKQPGIITYFSFTCTPTVQCLEMFGVNLHDNRVPFNTYSIDQALSDRLILDVTAEIKYPYDSASRTSLSSLTSSMTSGFGTDSGFSESGEGYDDYSVYNDDAYYDYEDELDVKKGSFKDDDVEDTGVVMEKSLFIVKHIIENKRVMDKGTFKSRAMLVCNGRKNLLVFKKTIDQLIQKLPLNEQFDTIAAFSPFVLDGKSIVESDVMVNGKYAHYGTDKNRGITKALLDDRTTRIKLILVADKLQTGFDEPSLSLMYVDKKIKGANAVQTLSRLSRVAPNKSSTIIIDFVNRERDIKQIFNLYRHSTTLRDLQDSPTLLNALKGYAAEIKEVFSQERNLNSFCKAILYHEEHSSVLSKKYKNMESAVESYIEIFNKLELRNESPSGALAISYKIVESMKKTLASLKREKQKELSRTKLDNVKVKIDYLTDEEAKKSELNPSLSVDYDAEFAAKLWACDDIKQEYLQSKTLQPKKNTLLEMTKKLDDIHKYTNYNSGIFKSNVPAANNTFNSASNSSSSSNGNGFYSQPVDDHLNYTNTNYQANFMKPIPSAGDYMKNKSNPTTTAKPAPVRTSLWASAALGKRPNTAMTPSSKPNPTLPVKRNKLEVSENEHSNQ